MALIQCSFFSDALGLSTTMNVILPQKSSKLVGMQTEAGERKYPTLYLLHGLSDDHSIWLRRTSIERYVSSLGLAVVMPAVDRSFYTDMASGNKYWTFVSEELPAIARSFFPLSSRREDNFVAGLSMGGYGAFKLGLRCADKFAAAASLSGALDLTHFQENNPHEFAMIFGTEANFRSSEDNLFHLLDHHAQADVKLLPRLFQACGTEDFLYGGNRKFLGYAQERGVHIDYEEEPGTHEWGYWDMKIRRVLEWLPLNG